MSYPIIEKSYPSYFKRICNPTNYVSLSQRLRGIYQLNLAYNDKHT